MEIPKQSQLESECKESIKLICDNESSQPAVFEQTIDLLENLKLGSISDFQKIDIFQFIRLFGI